jgi:hypothetical protein
MTMDSTTRVLDRRDIPVSAADNPSTTTAAADVTEVVVTAGSVRNITNMFKTNRYTVFEMLVFNISDGFTASQKQFKSDEDFARQACSLARAIAYEMEKYGTA